MKLNQDGKSAASAARSTNYQAVFIIGVLFFIFGFVTWLNGTLIPFLKLACQLDSDVQAFFVTFAFYMAYFCLALPSSFLIKKTGYKRGMSLGLFIMAAGSAIFIPAAHSRTFGLFLTGLFVQGMGLALLQTASNPYITIIGPIESAAKRISIMGICNKTAGMISPLILGALVLKNATALETQINTTSNLTEKGNLLQELAERVITPYAIITGILILLAFMIWFSPLPEIDTDQEVQDAGIKKGKSSVFQFPYLVLGVLCLFLYVGAEVMAGDAIGTYGKTQGLPLDVTKYFTFFTLAAMLAGYIAGIFTIPRIISQQTGLKISAVLGILFSTVVFLTHGYTSIVFIALLGLANAMIWPAIWPLAISGLGRFTKTGSALLVMGIAGGAIIPLVYSSLKDKLHVSNSLSFYVCMLPCYVYILFYAVRGHRAGK
ncbi:MAG: sugar MFS transporter [Bacteroidota bacterium]|nr:sugar MFS transporter [Bacteroidota bacterium]MDP4250688.1 sugar MFS transporter [Bacteroidota bacterium]